MSETETVHDELRMMNEAQLRDCKVAWPETEDELLGIIHTLIEREHDYGTCVYAMSICATAVFHYVANILGATGFQASCADMDILRRTRQMEGPFCIVNAENMLYPQYDIIGRVREFLDKSRNWAAKEAAKNLLSDPAQVHPNVWARWKELAARQEQAHE